MKRIGAAAIGLVALAGGSSLAAVEAPRAAEAGGPRADVVFRSVRLWHFRGSELDGVGAAAEVTYDRSAAMGVATSAEATLPGRKGDPRPVQFEAGTAEGHLAAHTLDARDGVVLRRTDGTVRSNSAHYDGPAHQVTGQEPVQVDTAQLHVQGQAFTLDTSTEQIDVQGPVEAQGEGR